MLLVHVLKLLFIFDITIYFVHGLQLIPERAGIIYVNKKYLKNDAVLNVRRYSRKSPYVINLQATTLHTWANNVSFTYNFYEYLHNEYKPSFIEMHFRFCDLVNKDQSIGFLLRQMGIVCPLPPGYVNLNNMSYVSVPTVDHLPYKWPFEKGKVVHKIETFPEKELIAESYYIITFKQAGKQTQTNVKRKKEVKDK